MLKTASPAKLYVGQPGAVVAAKLFTAARVTKVKSVHWATDATSSPTIYIWLVAKGGTADATNGVVTAQALVASSSGELIGNGISELTMFPGDFLAAKAGTGGTTLAVFGEVSDANTNN
jgi:hypothetical protein